MIQTQQNQEVRETDPYLTSFRYFESNGTANTPSWLYPIRKAGLARFAEFGFPTVQHEDWRFTNVAPIARLPFKPTFEYFTKGLTAQLVEKFTFANLNAHRLVFVNGHFSSELSSKNSTDQRIQITSLAQALSQESSILEKHLADYAIAERNTFAALNSAFFQDGAFIFIPRDFALEIPIHLLFVSTVTEPGSTSHPRNLIVAEQGSSATILESYASTANTSYFTNSVTQLFIGERARVEHCKFQDEALTGYHMATIQAHLGRGCNFVSHSIATGARLSRNNINTTLDGEGVECVLNGLYLTKDDQLADHHMIVEHAKPHCNSHEYYNGILDGRGRGVFHGRILVRPEAQKTDAKQTNKNLLLSDDATVNTKPQLEIYADDVKCTHGATIGQLNEESIFYLRARGIGLETARQMLIHAFAGEIIDRIRFQPARDELDQLIWDRLDQNPIIALKR